MFLNLSNHPSALWGAEQKAAAERFGGSITDLPFPAVDPAGDETYIAALADEYCRKVVEMAAGKTVMVHLMGEMTLTLALVRRLQAAGIPCLASTTRRVTVERDGVKTSVFKFVKFRKYSLL